MTTSSTHIITTDLHEEAVDLAARVDAACAAFPRSAQHFGDRLRGAATHVTRPLGRLKSTSGSDLRKDLLWDARRSLQECAGLIGVAVKQGLMADTSGYLFHVRLDDLAGKVQEMIRGTIGGQPGLTVPTTWN